MTAEKISPKGRPRGGAAAALRVAVGLLCVFLFLLILKNPEVASSLMRDALGLCARTVIPALFPFMVLSELMVSGGGARRLSPLLDRPARWLFGISGEGLAAALMGMLCGLPVGARGAVALRKAGRIDDGELTRILVLSGNPSSAFLIGAVGESMFGSRSFGVLLYCLSLASSLIIAALMGAAERKKKKPTATEAPSGDTMGAETSRTKGGVALFTSAVASSALSMLNICAFVVFFSTLVGVLEFTLSALSLPPWLSALCFAFFEMTAGMDRASALPIQGQCLAAFTAGWTGLSAHFQVMSVSADSGAAFRSYFLARLLSGGLCALAVWGMN